MKGERPLWSSSSVVPTWAELKVWVIEDAIEICYLASICQIWLLMVWMLEIWTLCSAGRNSHSAVHVQCCASELALSCHVLRSESRMPAEKAVLHFPIVPAEACVWLTGLWGMIQAAVNPPGESWNLDHIFVLAHPRLLRFPLSSYCLPSAQAVLECSSAAFKAKTKLEAGSHWSPTAERPDVPWGNLFAWYQRLS